MKTLRFIAQIYFAISLLACAAPVGICLFSYGPDAPPDKIECFEFEKFEPVFQGKRYFLKNDKNVIITDYRNRGVLLYPTDSNRAADLLKVYEARAVQSPATRQFLNPWILKLRNSVAETSKQKEPASDRPSLMTTDGKSYIGVTISKVEPDGIRIMHESGSAKIPFEKLSTALQEKYGYNVAKAVEFRRSQEAKDVAASAEPENINTLSAQSNSASNYRGNLERSGVYPDIKPFVDAEITRFVIVSKPFDGPVTVADSIWYYCENGDKFVRAANKDGVELWNYDTGTFGLAPCIYNELVISASMEGKITALDRKTGNLKWENSPKDKDSMLMSQPPVYKNAVYAGYLSGELAAMDATTGKKRWNRNLGSPISLSIAVADGLIYACTTGKMGAGSILHALNAADGEEKWLFSKICG